MLDQEKKLSALTVIHPETYEKIVFPGELLQDMANWVGYSKREDIPVKMFLTDYAIHYNLDILVLKAVLEHQGYIKGLLWAETEKRQKKNEEKVIDENIQSGAIWRRKNSALLNL